VLKKDPKIHIESQRFQIDKEILRKKNETRVNDSLILKYITKLLLPKLHSTGIKTHI
jgi:hypothetical protein